jgi:hypothetical protein
MKTELLVLVLSTILAKDDLLKEALKLEKEAAMGNFDPEIQAKMASLDKDGLGEDKACGCPTAGSTAYFLDLRYRVQEPDTVIMMTEIYGRDWLRWINEQLNPTTQTEWTGNRQGEAKRQPRNHAEAAASFSDWGPLRLNRIDYNFVYGGLVYTDNLRLADSGNNDWLEAHFSHKAIPAAVYLRVKNTAAWHVSRTPEYFIQEFERFGAMIFYMEDNQRVFYAKREREDLVNSPLEGDPSGERLGMNLPPIGRILEVKFFAQFLGKVLNDPYTAPEKELLIIAFGDAANQKNCEWCTSGTLDWKESAIIKFLYFFFHTIVPDLKKNFRKYSDVVIYDKYCKKKFDYSSMHRCKYRTLEVL